MAVYWVVSWLGDSPRTYEAFASKRSAEYRAMLRRHEGRRAYVLRGDRLHDPVCLGSE